MFFKISQIGIFWSKITIFSIEISLKLPFHTKYGWNKPNSCRLGLKSPKLKILLFFAVQILLHAQTFKYMSRAPFSSYIDFFFEMFITISSIRINNNWNDKKKAHHQGSIHIRLSLLLPGEKGNINAIYLYYAKQFIW